MSNYPLPYTAAQIQEYLEKVATPDGAPVGDSSALITSGAVAEALSNFTGSGSGSVNLTKEQIEALGISVDLDQIGDLDQLTLDFDSITGDVAVFLDDITDIGNLFINADHVTGTISANQIGNISMDNVDTINNLSLSANTVAGIDISATNLNGFQNMVTGVLGSVSIVADEVSPEFNWTGVNEGIMQAINTPLQNIVDGTLENYTITTNNLSAITNLSDISDSLNNTVNAAIQNQVNGALESYTVNAANIDADLTIEDYGAEGSTFRQTLNEAISNVVAEDLGSYTIDANNISANFTVDGMGSVFETAINQAITNQAGIILADYKIDANNIEANFSVSDLGTDFENAVNTAVDARIASNSGNITIEAEAITSDFDMSTFTGHADFQNAINSGVSVSLGNSSGDLSIDVGNLNADFILPIGNMDSDVGVLTGALIENNALKMDIGIMTGALTFSSSSEKQDFINQFQGDLAINTNVITGDITSSGNITIHADVITDGTIPAARLVETDISLAITQIADLLKTNNGVAVTETQIDENGNAVDSYVINQVVIPQELPNLNITSNLAAASLDANNITDGTLSLQRIDQTGLSITASQVTDFDNRITTVLGGTNFLAIDGSDIDLTDFNVAGLSIDADEIGNIDNKIESVASTMGFADISNSTLDLSGVAVSGLSVPHSAISDFDTEVSSIAAGLQLSNVTDSEINFTGMTVTGFDIANHIGTDDFNAAVTSAIGTLSFSDISGGSLSLTDVTVSGQSNLGLTSTHISDFDEKLTAALGTITFEGITNSTLDLTNFNVSGFSHTSVDGLTDRVADLTANIDASQLNFVDANGDISVGTGANDVGIVGLNYTHIENFTQEVESAAASLNFLQVDDNSEINLTDVTLTGLNLDLSELSSGTLPSNITLDVNQLTGGTIDANRLPITNSNLELLGADLDFVDLNGNLTIDAGSITGGTLNLENMDGFAGTIPTENIAGINIDVNQLSGSDIDIIVSKLTGNINIDIEHVVSQVDADGNPVGNPLNLLLDIDQVTGDLFLDASKLKGEIVVGQVTGLGGGSGLPDGTVWKEFVTLENGVPTKYWMPTLLSNPDE